MMKKEFRLTDQAESTVIYHVPHRAHPGKAKLLLSTEPRSQERHKPSKSSTVAQSEESRALAEAHNYESLEQGTK